MRVERCCKCPVERVKRRGLASARGTARQLNTLFQDVVVLDDDPIRSYILQIERVVHGAKPD